VSALRELPTGFGHIGRHLAQDGHDLVELAREQGTPLFIFSERRLRANAAGFLRAARAGHPKATVCYASKACSNLAVLQIIREEGLAIEVNSGGEISKAQAAGFTPAEMVFNGVAKSAAELERAVALGLKAINVDSPFELRRIAGIAAALGRRARVTLRAVPGVAGGATPGIQTGGADSKFGMTADEMAEAVAIAVAERAHIETVGIHIHIGSQVVETEAYLAGVKFAAEQARALAAQLGAPLRHVNLGGGYPTDYSHRPDAERSQRNEIDHFAAARPAVAMVAEVAGAAARAIGTDTEILFEPGRSIVADTALLLTQVEGIRRREELPWIYLDAGYNTLLDATAVRWYFHMVTANRLDQPAEQHFRVVGPLCDSADCFFDVEGEHLLQSLLRRLPELSPEQRNILTAEVVRLPATRRLAAGTVPGDLIALFDVGAYSLEEMFQYCGRLRPAAVMLGLDGHVRTMRRRDNDRDLMAHELAAEAC
jgi:diaminopimelate decarboxylase